MLMVQTTNQNDLIILRGKLCCLFSEECSFFFYFHIHRLLFFSASTAIFQAGLLPVRLRLFFLFIPFVSLYKCNFCISTEKCLNSHQWRDLIKCFDLRSYDAFGEKVGSKECKEGQIYIEPQGFCVLADVGVNDGQAKKALDSVKEKLDTKYGIVLLQPAYTTYHLNLGEISSYSPGYKENAGIFCHNNPWVSIAETRIGRGNRAFEIYRKTCPAYLEDISDTHRTEPYVYSQMIAGCI